MKGVTRVILVKTVSNIYLSIIPTYLESDQFLSGVNPSLELVISQFISVLESAGVPVTGGPPIFKFITD